MGIDEHSWRAVISGERRGLAATAARGLLRGLSVPYAAAAGWRRRRYASGALPAHRADVPVVSVGNITAGGTGKTPLVAHVVRRLHALGRRPAILSRGYKATAAGADEPEMLRRMTGAPVIENPDRIAGAAEAVRQGADACVLDDGFQHRRLQRDLDIVTIDATCPFGYGAVLPRGLLREPLWALAEADVLVLTRCDQAPPAQVEAAARRLAELASRAPVLRSVMRPEAVCSFDGTRRGAEVLSRLPVWAFCGLGNPGAFHATLDALGARCVGRTSFNDHHAYTAQDLHRLRRQARPAGATCLVTTAKDAVKLERLPGAEPDAPALPVVWLEVELAILDGAAALDDALRRACQGGSR